MKTEDQLRRLRPLVVTIARQWLARVRDRGRVRVQLDELYWAGMEGAWRCLVQLGGEDPATGLAAVCIKRAIHGYLRQTGHVRQTGRGPARFEREAGRVRQDVPTVGLDAAVLARLDVDELLSLYDGQERPTVDLIAREGLSDSEISRQLRKSRRTVRATREGLLQLGRVHLGGREPERAGERGAAAPGVCTWSDTQPSEPHPCIS